MFGAAAGMATTGLIPYVATFASFAGLLGYEAIRTDLAYPYVPVRVLATHAGISMGFFSTSHHATEDISALRSIADLMVLSPADGESAAELVRATVDHPGPIYFRLGRGREQTVYETAPENYRPGAPHVVRRGEDVLIAATGIMVPNAVEAAEQLAASGVSATVLDVHTLKPFAGREVVEHVTSHPLTVVGRGAQHRRRPRHDGPRGGRGGRRAGPRGQARRPGRVLHHRPAQPLLRLLRARLARHRGRRDACAEPARGRLVDRRRPRVLGRGRPRRSDRRCHRPHPRVAPARGPRIAMAGHGLLDGKVAAITGASRSIGLSVARRYAEEGASVVLADIDAAGAEAAAAELTDAGLQATAVHVDVTDPDSVDASVQACVGAFGRVDIAVANAGILHLAPLTETEPAAWQRVIDVNLTGVFLTLRAFGARLIEQGEGGCLIATSSLFGVRGGRENVAYAATKFGVVGLVQCAAADLAPHAITVNAVAPGQVVTPMGEQLVADKARLRGVAAAADPRRDLCPDSRSAAWRASTRSPTRSCTSPRRSVAT